jgi:8-oxo-dGTP diphosphatase
MSRPEAAASAACFRNGKLLLAERTEPRGLWTLPGGRIELGETAQAAALRELKEETGIDGELAGFAGYREMIFRDKDRSPKRHFVILAFAVRWRAGEIQPSPEVGECRWIDPAELGSYRTTEGLAEIVAIAQQLVRG